MSTENETKINKLLKSHPTGAVMISSWLTERGYSLDLQKRYRKSGWLDSIGSGAMIRAGDEVSYEGGIHALQKQLKFSVHPGGRTALTILGRSHYLEMAPQKIVLFGAPDENLPAWFLNHDWGIRVEYHRSSFLPAHLGLVDVDLKTFSIKVSGAARAVMECLYLAPGKQDLLECYEIMEGLNNLRPDHVQPLLEGCSSIKVKRLFVYMAEKAGHAWLDYLDMQGINLGSGKRHLAKNGVYVAKYHMTVPKELG